MPLISDDTALFGDALRAVQEREKGTISLGNESQLSSGRGGSGESIGDNPLVRAARKGYSLSALNTVRLDAGVDPDSLYLTSEDHTRQGTERRLHKGRTSSVVSMTAKGEFGIVEVDAGVNTGGEASLGVPRRSVRDGLVSDKTQVGQESIVMTRTKKERIPKSLDYTKKQKKAMKKETTGPKWFDMPAPELTDEVKRDLQVLKMRSALDKKQHYKKGTMDKKRNLKYFQVGTIVESKAQFYSSRLTNKERKKNLVDQYLL